MSNKIKLLNGTEVSAEEFYSWSAHKQQLMVNGELRAKMAAARVGKIHHTPESKAAISAVHRGRALTPEHRAKLSAAKRGKPKSEAWRNAIAAANKHVASSPEERSRRAEAMKKIWAARKAAKVEQSDV